MAGKASSGHLHDDRYYTESEMDTKLSGKAASSHTHDDRYYTKSGIDAKDFGGSTCHSYGAIGYGISMHGRAVAYGIGNGKYVIKVTAVQYIETEAGATDTNFEWGLNLTSILAQLDLPTGLVFLDGDWLMYNADGQLLHNRVQYGGNFVKNTLNNYKVLIPSRYYNTSAANNSGPWPAKTLHGVGNTMYATLVVG